MNTMAITTAAFFLVLLGHANAASIGVYPVKLCPSNSSSNRTSTTWQGTSSPSAQSACATPLEPASQAIFVNSLAYAQQNKPQYVPRSNTYALSVLRAAMVTTVYLDFEISDATGRTLVPRTQIHLKPSAPSDSPLPQLSSRRMSDEATATELPGRLSESTATPIPKGKRSGHSRSPFRGRRKGKGGIMGGIGGGGRYGGGTGGFRASGSTGKSYGYSTGAMNARYAPGYSQTGYGYHGRSVMFVGAPMYLYSRGHHGSRDYYSDCSSQYSGDQQTRCQSYYSNCRYSGTSNYSACSVQTNGELIRDDIMAASIDSTKAAFPLNITVHEINATFRAGSQPDPWANAVLFTFSEVDFDDENDADMEFWVFCLLMSFALIALCCGVGFCWGACCDFKCCCNCDNSSTDTENHPVSRTSSKVLEEVDLEAQGGSNACVVSNGPEQATVDSNGPVQATVVTVHGHYQDAHSEDKKDVPA